MKSQLDVCAVESANCCDTAMSSGTAPKTYHKKAVKPAHNAAELNSPSSGLQFTFRSYRNRSRNCRGRHRISTRPSTPLPLFSNSMSARRASQPPSHGLLFMFFSALRSIPVTRPSCHRITLSALANTLGGIVSPICLAAFRLIMNSNLIGCSTGKSAGLAPFKILST